MSRWIVNLVISTLFACLVLILGSCRAIKTPAVPSTTQKLVDLTATQLPSQPAPIGTSTSFATNTSGAYPEVAQPTLASTSLAYPQPSSPGSNPTAEITNPSPYPIPGSTQYQSQPIQSPTASLTPSFGAGTHPTATSTQAIQQATLTPPAYPGPVTSTPANAHQSVTATFTAFPDETQISPAPTGESTATLTPSPTELPPPSPLSPPPAGSSITIWHSWDSAEIEVLQSVIQSFKRAYPEVTFELMAIPVDDLFGKYEEAAYQGQGPSLLLGPSNWGPRFYDETIIADLAPYIPPELLTNINIPSLSLGYYKSALISLPLSLHGELMFRNTSLISTAPTNFSQLMDLSMTATQNGNVGSYLERGAIFSAPALIGLGGQIMDAIGNPLFTDEFSREWLDLLSLYDQAGAVTLNTNLDLDMFKRGKVGIIFDVSQDISLLGEAVGADNLAIDPWPTFGTGHMTGWLEADSVYLNANTSGDDRFASLAFAYYMLDPNVQLRLAEVGHIPSVMTTQPRDKLIQEAMLAFSGGVAYPNSLPANELQVYWDELDGAIQAVFTQGADLAIALETARSNIIQTLQSMQHMR